MLKYVDTKEVFAEVPDEITLAISISGCPIRCRGCHSRYLWEDTGEPLTPDALSAMLAGHRGVTCVCFMGGDQDPNEVNSLAQWVRQHHRTLRTAWYSGRDRLAAEVRLENFDYVKLGRYDSDSGPLNSRTTNQHLWRVEPGEDGEHVLTELTHRFWGLL